jgi:hypothetical protein
MNRYQKILAETRVAFDERRPLPPRPRGPRGAAESKTERRAKRMAQTHDWDRIQQKLEAEVAALQANPGNLSEENDYEGADKGEYRAGIYLGSYIISPSGKVYAPWAHSNLTPCPACKGTGRRKPRNEIERLHVAEKKRLSAGGSDHMTWPGSMTVEWTEYIGRANAVYLVNQDDGTLDCAECSGHQFAEAWADMVWTGEMERLAEERGLSFDQEDYGYFVFYYFTVDTEDDACEIGEEEPRLHSESDSATTAVVLTPDGTVVSADRTTTFTTMSFKGCA